MATAKGTQTEPASDRASEKNKAVVAMERATGERGNLQMRRVKNASQKLIWLPLNSGARAPIPAGQERAIPQRDLEENAAFAKLVARRDIKDLGPASRKIEPET